MNFMRKSTEGWSIVNILLDFSGSVANYAQMSMQSIDQRKSSSLPKDFVPFIVKKMLVTYSTTLFKQVSIMILQCLVSSKNQY